MNDKWKSMLPAGHQKTSLVIAGLLLLVFVLVIADFWGVRFTTNDDANNGIWGYTGHSALGLAKGQGRIYHLYHFPILLFIFNFWKYVAYDILQYGSYLLALISVGAAIAAFLSLRIAAFFLLLYCASLIGTWDHTLMTSVPFYHFVVVINMALVALVIAAYRRSGSWFWLPLLYLLFVLACIGQEYQVIFISAVFFFCVMARKPAWNTLPDWPRRRWRLIAGAALLAVIYVVAAIGWRLAYGNSYDGAEVKLQGFDWRNALNVFFVWSLSGNIFAHWYKSYMVYMSVGDVGQFFPVGLSMSAVFSTLQAWDLVKAAAIAVAGFYILMRIEARRFSLLGLFAGIVLAGVIAFTPSFFLALTPKYQDWFRQGVRAYTYTSLSNIGLMFGVTAGLLALEQWISMIFLRRMLQVVIILLLTLAGITSAHHNHVVARSMKEAGARWTALDMAMRTPIKEEIRGKILIGTRFSDYFWAIPGRPEYWEKLLKGVYGVDVSFRRRIDASTPLDGSQALIYVDHGYLSWSGESLGLVAQVSYDQGRLMAQNLRILSERPVNAGLQYQDRQGSTYRVILGGALKPERVNDVYVYTLSAREINVATVRIDEQLLWAFPKVVDGEPYRLGSKIEFGISGTSGAYKSMGWSGTEAQITWAVGPVSRLRFLAMENSSCDLKVSLDGWGFFVPGKMAPPIVTVSVNGQSIWSGPIAEPRLIEFTIPRRLWQAGRFIEIRFDHPFAAVPRDVGHSPDTRPLAIALRSLMINGCPSNDSTAGNIGYGFGENLAFQDGGSGIPVLGQGWSTPESGHVWSLGGESTVAVPLAQLPRCDIEIGIRAMPFYVSDKMVPPRLDVLVNGEAAGSAQNFDREIEMKLRVPQAIAARYPVLDIRFRHPDFRTPKSVLGSNDERPISLGLKALQIGEKCP
jgi:hypothetical protein